MPVERSAMLGAQLRVVGLHGRLVMRNTVFCAIPAEAAEPGPQRGAIEANIHAVVDTVRQYVPGYSCAPTPSSTRPMTAGAAWPASARRVTPACTAASCCTLSAPPSGYGVAAHEILQRVGEAGYVGGQEDMIIDIAIQLAQRGDGVPA